MDKARAMAGISAILALFSVALAVSFYEGIMAVTAFFSLVYGVVAFDKCYPKTCRILTVTTIIILISTILSVTILAPDNFLGPEGDPTTTWFVIIGLVHSAPVIPLTLCTFTIIASFSGASYNWAIVRYFSPFIGMGMEVPGFVLEYIFEGADNWMTDNGYILYHFLMTMIVLIVSSHLISGGMRKNGTIITARGRERLEC